MVQHLSVHYILMKIYVYAVTFCFRPIVLRYNCYPRDNKETRPTKLVNLRTNQEIYSRLAKSRCLFCIGQTTLTYRQNQVYTTSLSNYAKKRYRDCKSVSKPILNLCYTVCRLRQAIRFRNKKKMFDPIRANVFRSPACLKIVR